MTLFGKLHVTSKPPTPENDADVMADARKLAAIAKKMSKAEAARILAEEAGVSEKASDNSAVYGLVGLLFGRGKK